MNDSLKIKVFLVDDHPLVRDGIQSRLLDAEDIEVVGQASNGKEALEQVEGHDPDIVLMDISMPVMGGVETTELLKKQHPDIKVLILSMHDEYEYIVKLMKSGAKGYILKDVSSDDLINAIRSVHQGNTSFCSGTAQSLFSQTPSATQVVKSDVLSHREIDILKLIADGKCNKNVARTLNISVRTVETHRLNIKTKLGVQTTAALTRYAIENDIV